MSEAQSYQAGNIDKDRVVYLASDFDNVTRLFLDAAERCIASERREKELQQRLTAADEELDRAGSQYINKNADCTWSQDASGLWNSTCGVTWGFMDGSPHSHGMHFCHSCGKMLVVEPVKPYRSTSVLHPQNL